jgi:hypothetical protein
MLNRIALGTLVILCALALVTPAGAVTVNGVDYILLGRIQILMENSADCDPLPANTLGCMILTGNIGVSDPNGILKIGANNIINGTVTAHHIAFGTNSHVTECRFDVSSGVDPATVCGTIVSPLPAGTLPIVAAWPPGPLGPVTVDPCVNTAANVTVAAGATQGLPPGCYRDIRVNAGGTLNLGVGTYNIRNVRLIAGANLHGNGATANVRDLFITEAGVTIDNIVIKSPGSAGFSVTEFINIFNGSNLSNVVLYAPTAGIHLHTGFTGNNIEAVANFLTVEPGIVNNAPGVVCACFEGVALVGTNVLLSGGHQLNDPGNKFFLSPTCDPAAGVQVTATAVSDTNATLDVTGKTTTGRHVIVQSTAGTFCSATTLP